MCGNRKVLLLWEEDSCDAQHVSVCHVTKKMYHKKKLFLLHSIFQLMHFVQVSHRHLCLHAHIKHTADTMCLHTQSTHFYRLMSKIKHCCFALTRKYNHISKQFIMKLFFDLLLFVICNHNPFFPPFPFHSCIPHSTIYLLGCISGV